MESLDWHQLLIHSIPSLITSREFHTLICAVIYSSFNEPWRWKHYVTPIFFHPLIKLHGVPGVMISSPAFWTEVFVCGLMQKFIVRKFVLKLFILAECPLPLKCSIVKATCWLWNARCTFYQIWRRELFDLWRQNKGNDKWEEMEDLRNVCVCKKK
jgi:hypothetical protein